MPSVEDIYEIINGILDGESSKTIDLNDDRLENIKLSAKTRLALTKKGIACSVSKQENKITFTRMSESETEREPSKDSVVQTKRVAKAQHEYVPPRISQPIMDALMDEASHVLQFVGPTQCGKTLLTEYLAPELGMVHHKIVCFGEMDYSHFFGEKIIVVDPESMQSNLKWQDGPVLNAMQEGLDEDGNEVGPPALLLIDEFGAAPAHISIALNHLLESNNPKREIVLSGDGGRRVVSHSGFRIILASNTTGRGATDMSSAMYAAQMDAQDISVLNRVAMTFRFGYDRKVEENIIMQKIGDDRVVKSILHIRDAIRDQIRAGKLSTPFSTGTIKKIADAYRIYGDLAKAVYYTTIEALLPEERHAYNEIIKLQTNVDILNSLQLDDMDYM